MTSSEIALGSQPLLLPVLVFVAETCVVTLSTVRTIFITRGRKVLAPLLGVVEISIWLFAIAQVMQHLRDPACYIAFAGGFAVGNLLGIVVEKRLALGSLVVRLITARDVTALVHELCRAKYGVTCLDGHGAMGPVQVVLTVVPRRELRNVVSLIEQFDP